LLDPPAQLPQLTPKLFDAPTHATHSSYSNSVSRERQAGKQVPEF